MKVIFCRVFVVVVIVLALSGCVNKSDVIQSRDAKLVGYFIDGPDDGTRKRVNLFTVDWKRSPLLQSIPGSLNQESWLQEAIINSLKQNKRVDIKNLQIEPNRIIFEADVKDLKLNMGSKVYEVNGAGTYDLEIFENSIAVTLSNFRIISPEGREYSKYNLQFHEKKIYLPLSTLSTVVYVISNTQPVGGADGTH